MPASRRTFTHAARHCSSVPYRCSNSASVSPCMIARIDPIPYSPDSILHRFCGGRKGADWLISGFCFHYYWFSGRKILETPLETFLTHPEIDIGFCLNWANENWTRIWDGSQDDVLLKQNYSTVDDEKFIDGIERSITEVYSRCFFSVAPKRGHG